MCNRFLFLRYFYLSFYFNLDFVEVERAKPNLGINKPPSTIFLCSLIDCLSKYLALTSRYAVSCDAGIRNPGALIYGGLKINSIQNNPLLDDNRILIVCIIVNTLPTVSTIRALLFCLFGFLSLRI